MVNGSRFRNGEKGKSLIRNASDSSEMNYADNEADDDTMRLSPSTQLSTNDSDIFTENFESDSWLGFPRRDQLPPPPSDHELLALQTTSASRRVGDPLVYSSTTNNESLLSTAVDVSIPTPAAARKKRFHPNQYLVDYQYSDVSCFLGCEDSS